MASNNAPHNNSSVARGHNKVVSAAKRSKAARFTAVLGAFVVFCTAWALMVPAITITQDNAQPEVGFYANDDAASTDGAAKAAGEGADAGAAAADDATVADTAAPAEGAAPAREDATDAAAQSPVDSDAAAATTTQASSPVAATTPLTLADSEMLAPSAMPARSFDQELSTSDGNVLAVHVDADEGTFAADVQMQVEEVVNDDVISYVKDTAVYNTEMTYEKTRAIAVDITFVDVDGNEAQPEKDVHVSMTTKALAQTSEMAVVHMDNEWNVEMMDAAIDAATVEVSGEGVADGVAAGEAATDEAETADAESADASDDVNSAADGSTATSDAAATATSTEAGVVSFDAASFSVYAIVYTVDFHYEVDGQTYEYSIQGGDTISLKELLPILGVIEQDQAQAFVDDIETVEFSDPELIAVDKITISTTAGDLKAYLGVEPEYSANLTDDEIAEMDAKQLTSLDWALVTLKPFDTEEWLTITMANGDVFTIKVTDASDPLGLNGKSYAIVNQRDGNGAWYALKNEIDDTRDGRGYYMSATALSGAPTTEGSNLYCDTSATLWTFEYLGNEYYRVSCDGQYLWIDPAITTKNDSADHSLNLVTEKGNGDPTQDGTCIKITKDNDGNYRLGNQHDVFLWDYNNSFWLSSLTEENDNETNRQNVKMRLCIPESTGDYADHKAQMIAAKDLKDGQTIVVYQKVWNSTTDEYDYYAVDGDGNIVRVYMNSDSIYWKGNQSVEWTLVEYTTTGDDGVERPTGYYELVNTTTGKVLAPQSTAIVHDNNVGINLPGVADATYTSKIGAWDASANTTYGLKFGEHNDDALAFFATEYLQSDEFMFATRDPIVQNKLTTVDTVDSKSMGINITMYNFSGDYHDGGNGHDRVTYMSEVFQPGHVADGNYNGWAPNTIHQNLVTNTLTTNGVLDPKGFPTSNASNGSWIGNIFYPPANAGNNYSVQRTDNVNNLFVQSVYDATGYFHYSSFENFATLDGSDFRVYEQVGTPSTRNELYFQRGNFMPYNDLDPNYHRQNRYDSNGALLSQDDPRYNENLYYIEGYNGSDNPEPTYADFFFGMTMDAKFIQNPDGVNDFGDPMVFRFNGDDDMWVYIDGVRILDIGGVHDAWQGSINFQTGEVKTRNNGSNVSFGSTWIPQLFHDAGLLPNGDPWDDSRASEFFENYEVVNGVRHGTFKDYSTHDFRMIYMERGAGASNLELEFNLPVLTGSQFSVKKEMPTTASGGAIQDKYADSEFYYQAYVKDSTDDYRLVTRTEFPDLVYDNGRPVVWKTENKFAIKPGHSITFPVASDKVSYYVKEVEPEDPAGDFPGSDMLNNFWVSNSDPDTSVTHTVTLSGEDYTSYEQTLQKTVQERGLVVFTNKPDEGHVNELQIVKELDGELIRDANGDLIADAYGNGSYFEYKVFLESTDGQMVPYSQGGYYQIDGEKSTADTPHYVYYKPDPRDSTKSIRVTAVVTDNGNGTYTYTYDQYTDGSYSYTPPRETLNEFKFTEHASQNGSIADIRPGDKIIIPGLLEGTDFVVDERTDRTHIATGLTEDEGKVGQQYIYQGTTVENAYIRPDINAPQHLVGSIYDPPDYSGISYDQNRGALGTILPKSQTQNKDALVTVKNRGNQGFGIELEKKWSSNFTDDIKNGATATFTVQRYKLATKAGSVTLTGTLVDKPAGATPVYKFINEDNVVVKTVPLSAMTAGESGTYTITVTDLPVGEYTVALVDATTGYEVTSDPAQATVSVPEDGTATVSITSTYAKQTGYLEIMKKMTGEWHSDTNFSATYTISAEGVDPQTVTLTAADLNGTGAYGWTKVEGSDTWTKDIGPLPIGTYTVAETVSGGGSGTHTPESRAVTVTKGTSADTKPVAVFTGTYEARKIPVTIHFGYSPNNGNGWNESGAAQTFQMSQGATINVPFSVRQTTNFDGVYPYYVDAQEISTNRLADGDWNHNSDGNVQANVAVSGDAYTTKSQSFTIPSNATAYHIYIKSLCNNSYWTPTLNGTPTEVSQSRVASTFAAGVSRLMAAGVALRAAGDGSGATYAVTATNNVSAGTLPTNADTNKKYVLDDSWQMQVDMTASTYTQRIGSKSGSDWNWATVKDNEPYANDDTIPSVPWHQLLEHHSIVAKDANGNLYYYFISQVDENGVPTSTMVTFDMDADDDTKTQVAYWIDEADNNKYLSVLNDVSSSLKVTKNVTVNGEAIGADPTADRKALFNNLVDGTYSFTITGKADTPTAGVSPITVAIAITDGVAGYELINNLKPGTYIVTENNPNNGTTLEGGEYSREVTLTAGAIGNDAPEVSFTNNIDTTQVTVNKTWTDGADRHADDSITYTLYRTPSAGETVYDSEEVTSATGFTGALSAANHWTETVSNLPKTGKYTLADSSHIAVSYDYYVFEGYVEGYNSSTSGGVDGDGNYSFTITNKPQDALDQQTELNISKDWKDAEGTAENDAHDNDTITVQLTQKKYRARYSVPGGTNVSTNVGVYPIKVELYNADGSLSSYSKVVYMPSGGIVKITANSSSNGMVRAHNVRYHNNENMPRGTTFEKSISAATTISLTLQKTGDVWGATSDNTTWRATIAANSSNYPVIEESDLLDNLVLDGNPAATSEFGYTMALNATKDNTVLTPSGTGAQGVTTGTGKWSGKISELPFFQKDGSYFYVYTYEVSEIRIGSEVVGATTQAGFNGETSKYYVKWEENPANSGSWTVTNQRKPFITLTVRKVAQSDVANATAETTTLPGATFKVEKYTDDTYNQLDTSYAVEISDTQNTGVFTFSDLPIGYYKITETYAPAGYVKSTEAPCFQVVNDNGTLKVVLANGTPAGMFKVQNDTTLYFGNTPGTPLPVTGGPGTKALLLAGGILTVLALAVLTFRRKQSAANVTTRGQSARQLASARERISARRSADVGARRTPTRRTTKRGGR